MPNKLQKIVKLTQAQYDILEAGGTVGSYTGLDPNYIYHVEDTNEYVTTVGDYTLQGHITFASGLTTNHIYEDSNHVDMLWFEYDLQSGSSVYTEGHIILYGDNDDNNQNKPANIVSPGNDIDATLFNTGFYIYDCDNQVGYKISFPAQSGTFALVEDLIDYAPISHTHSANDITTGVLADARIPSLSASKITSGTFDIARIPTGNTSTTVALGNHNHDGVYVKPTDLSTVAITGSYNDLTDKPTIPVVDYPVTDVKVGNTSVVTNKVAILGTLAGKSSLLATDIPSLDASKITSGTFADARIASASTWNSKYTKPATGIPASDLAESYALSTHNHDGVYVKPSDLATVATTGNYNDLSNKPTIPTVNDGMLTIQTEGISKGTFTANQSGNTTINITKNDFVKTRTYTGLIGTTNEYKNAGFYFIEVMPTSWNAEWSIRYRIEASIDDGLTPTNYQYMHSVHECYIGSSHGNVQNWAFFNSINNTSYRTIYYNLLQQVTEAGYNNNYPHLIGVELTSAYERLNVNYKRTVKITIIEVTNCTVEFLDAPKIPSMSTRTDYVKLNATYYPTAADANTPGGAWRGVLYSNGLQEASDDNSVNRLYCNDEYHNISSDLGLPGYSIIGFDKDGNVNSISLPSANFTNNNSYAISETRVYNTVGFDWTRGLGYYTSSGFIAKATTAKVNFNRACVGVDLRYTDNVNNANNTPLTIIGTKDLYFRGTIGSDGLFYLAPYTVTYNNKTYKKVWTQDIPTTEDGYVYWLMGTPYNSTTYTMSVSLHIDNRLYWFKDGRFREYNPIPVVDYPVTDVKVGNTSVVTNKVAVLGALAGKDKISSTDLASGYYLPSQYISQASANGNTLTLTSVGGTTLTYTPSFTIPTKDSDLTNDRYVRYDTSTQGLTTTQQANARANIGATNNTGTVTSVGLSMPSIFTVTSSPVTSSGTITVILNDVAYGHRVFAGPSDGTAGNATFRALVADDIPSLNASKINAGTFADARIASASTWNSKYTKPATGIPASDLAESYALSTHNHDGVYVKPADLGALASKDTISASDVASGYYLPTTYIKSASVSGNTLTLTKEDNTTVSFSPSGGSATDVQINGTSITSGGVANIPYASDNVAGVVSISDQEIKGLKNFLDGVYVYGTKDWWNTGNNSQYQIGLYQAGTEDNNLPSLTFYSKYYDADSHFRERAVRFHQEDSDWALTISSYRYDDSSDSEVYVDYRLPSTPRNALTGSAFILTTEEYVQKYANHQEFITLKATTSVTSTSNTTLTFNYDAADSSKVSVGQIYPRRVISMTADISVTSSNGNVTNQNCGNCTLWVNTLDNSTSANNYCQLTCFVYNTAHTLYWKFQIRLYYVSGTRKMGIQVAGISGWSYTSFSLNSIRITYAGDRV